MSKKRRPTPVPAPFIPGLIDAHTHLTSCRDSAVDLLERARAAGVTALCTVGDGLDEAEEALTLATTYNHLGLWAACAVHPTRAAELDDAGKARLIAMARHPECVAIGETGLDAYWIDKLDTCAPLDQQAEALRWHMKLAATTNKALMIHNRDADDELLDILATPECPSTVILHCFSSPLAVGKEALRRGYILSFSGNLTFSANTHLREAAALAPRGQFLIETDAPYMTPEPFRGARNEPSLIGHTALCLATLRGTTPEKIASELRETFGRVYSVAL